MKIETDHQIRLKRRSYETKKIIPFLIPVAKKYASKSE
jgi:hypothetical protein